MLMQHAESYALLWTWVASLIGRMAQNGEIPPMPSPTYGRILNIVQQAYARFTSLSEAVSLSPDGLTGGISSMLLERFPKECAHLITDPIKMFLSLTGGALGCCWACERRRCLLFGALSSLICLSIAALGQSSFRCGEAVALTMFMGNAVAVWQPPVLLSGQVGPVCMPAGSLMLPGGPSWELDVS